jgi:hypothetical protein
VNTQHTLLEMADTTPTEGGAYMLLAMPSILTRQGGAGFPPVLLRVMDSEVIPPVPDCPHRRLLLVLSDDREFVIAVLNVLDTRRVFRDLPHGVPSGCIIKVILWETEQREEQLVVNLLAFYIIPGSPGWVHALPDQ